MHISCYRIAQDGHLTRIPPESLLEPWKKGEGQYWLDIASYGHEELEEWLKTLGVSAMAIKCCVSPAGIPRVLPLDDAVYFEFPVCNTTSSEGEPKADHAVFLCLKNLGITIYNEPVTKMDHIVEALASELRLMKASTSALTCLLLAAESTQVAQMVTKLRKTVFDLDERMDRDPESVSGDEIREQKRELRVYETIAVDQVACLELLRTVDTPFLSIGDTTTYYQFAGTSASAAAHAASRLDKTIGDLSQRFDSHQQDKTNHRLAVLTIFSAIFMPITLLAGIYGMNFKWMPELQFTWGYPVFLVLMLLIAVGMYRYFKTHGWLD